ncbi:MAG: EAL domain-containing protein [Solirubrobacteraceae bacterium]|nr:EAL domain-containing protein [Solirubrobacteraceae bacterium]
MERPADLGFVRISGASTSRLKSLRNGRLAVGLLALIVIALTVVVSERARDTADSRRQAQAELRHAQALGQQLRAAEAEAYNTDRTDAPQNIEAFDSAGKLQKSLTRMDAMDVDQKTIDALQVNVRELLRYGTEALQLGVAGKRQEAYELQKNEIAPRLSTINDLTRNEARSQDRQAADAASLARWTLLGSLLLGLVVLVLLAWRFEHIARRAKVAAATRKVERQSEERLRALAEHATDVVIVLDEDLHINWQAASMARVFGQAPDALATHPFRDIVHPRDRDAAERRLNALLTRPAGTTATLNVSVRDGDGHFRPVEIVAANRLSDEIVGGLLLSIRDVTERHALEAELRHQAYHDALTGLPNRTLFEQHLSSELREAAETGERLAIIFVDLDDFKTINDSLGHHSGDELLRVVATRIRQQVTDDDVIARLGGDEFAVLLHEHDEDAKAPQIVAEQILRAVCAPMTINERELRVSGSAGIAIGAKDATPTADEMLRNADVAMYASKSAGKNRVAVFTEDMHADAMRRLELTADLRRALEEGGLHLEYQPIVDMEANDRVVGAEALARWPHPVHGRIPPPEFIDLAEESGLILPLGAWVLETACAQMKEWMDDGKANAGQHVSVNVSALQMADPGMHDMVRDTLTKTGLDPRQLQLEITESVLVERPEAMAEELAALIALGVRVAIDDFGTGHSVLAYLRQLPVDVLKVDKAFIDAIDLDDGQAQLAQGIINLAHALDITVVAEGIETTSQAIVLRGMGPVLGQGYLYSRPADVAHAGALLRDGIQLPPENDVSLPNAA